MAVDHLFEDADQRKRLRSLVLKIIVVVILLHVAAGIIAGIFVVARYFTASPAQFEIKKDIRLPAKEREHRMNMAEFDALTPKPSFNDQLASLRPTDFALPNLPKVPLDQMLPLDPSELIADSVASLVGTAGLGGGGAGVDGLGGSGGGLSFMGIQTNAKRIVLAFDVSKSVVNKMARSSTSMKDIKAETLRLIEAMPANSRFGIVQFTQNYQMFKEELVPASETNKQAARDWIEREWTEEGTLQKRGVVPNPEGLLGVLRAVDKLKPDALFLISDASFQNRTSGAIKTIPHREFEKYFQTRPENYPIHFIAFEAKPEDRKFWRRIASHTGGKFKEAN